MKLPTKLKSFSLNQQNFSILGTVILTIICSLSIWTNWLKILSLTDDSGRSLFEAYRFSQGEMIYQDFTVQYPPLGIWLMGYAFRFFGDTFLTAQIILNILSLFIAFLTWHLARKVIPELLALATTSALILQLSFKHVLFSLDCYSYSQLTGMIGILLILVCVVDYLKGKTWTLTRQLIFGLGSIISLLSKPEFIVATIVCIGTLAIVDLQQTFYNKPIKNWLYQYLYLSTLAIIPALFIYFLIASSVGLDNLIAGLTGYGVGTKPCPWWPTGLALFGVLATLGQGIAGIALFSLLYAKVLYQYSKPKYGLLWLMAALGITIFILYYYYFRYIFHPVTQSISLFSHLGYLLQLHIILLPILWSAILYLIIQTKQIAIFILKKEPITTQMSLWYVLTATGLALTIRTLFGGHASNQPTILPISYPVFTLVAIYFLVSLQQKFEKINQLKNTTNDYSIFTTTMWLKFRNNFIILIIIIYAGIHGLGLVRVILPSYDKYIIVNTIAGQVKILDPNSIVLYKYIIDHSVKTDFLLSISYTSGINFATHRRSPVASTQFTALAPSREFLNTDLERLKRNPPKLVITDNHPSLGAGYGWWPVEDVFIANCSFPYLVWISEPAYSINTPFPVIEYVKTNYKPQTQIGNRVIWIPN